MKRFISICIVLFFMTTIAMAQPQKRGQFDPKERAKSQTEKLTEALELNDDQSDKVYDLNLKYNKKMGELRGQMREGGSDARSKMMKMNEEKNKEMKPILTEKQWEKYKELESEMRGRRGQGQNKGQGKGKK